MRWSLATVFTIEKDMISKIFSVATLRNRSIGQCNSIIKIMLAGIELEKTAEETAVISLPISPRFTGPLGERN